jgi:XTP/dITP diphosphohydrolase
VPKLVIATRNAHKTREIQQLFGDSFQVRDLSTVPDFPEIIESGATLAENARIKALAASQTCDGLVLADDSGLEVDALSGAPGVFSARYAGKKATDQQNREKLLYELRRQKATGDDRRTARFRCVLALARAGQFIRAVEGVVEGTIVDAPRGTGGFGYDPIFRPLGYDQTFGELPAETKNQISHRARAIQKLRDYLAAG